MYNIHFAENAELKDVASEGHYNQVPTITFLPGAPGMAWSMFTEAKAFTKFALYLLERKGLKASSYTEFMTMYNEYPMYPGVPAPIHREGMGQGISIKETTDFGNTFGHGGNNGDFKCYFEIYDELKMGYILFTNADTGHFYMARWRNC